MRRRTIDPLDEVLSLPGPYDGPQEDDLWFLPEAREEDGPLWAPAKGLVDTAAWKAAEAELAFDLAELSFDMGRLSERLRLAGPGAVQRLALEEAAALSWWTGDRVASDRLALWLSYRIGATEEFGDGLIRTAWAARRLGSAPAYDGRIASALAIALGEDGRVDPGLLGDVAAELEVLAGMLPVTRGAALFQLWRSLDERPDHLRGLEAAVLGMRLSGQGALTFLPLALTGFGALTASGPPEVRLGGWVRGAHRSVLGALMALDRLADWRARAESATANLSGRTPARLIAALDRHPMLGAAQAEEETGASRAAVQRNLGLLLERGLIREVTGHDRFRVWAAKL